MKKAIVLILMPFFVFAEGTSTKGTATDIPTGIILAPTGWTKKKRIGGDLGFAYYIGELWRKEGETTDYLKNQIKTFYFIGDIKTKLLSSPGVSFGGEGFVVLKGGQPTGGNYGGGGEWDKTETFGLLYGVASQRIGKSGIHLGYIYGPIYKVINPILGDIDLYIDAETSYFLGVTTNIGKRGIGIEVICPEKASYILVNTSIDKFLGFNLSFLKGKDLFSLIGYFGVRLNIF
ncbi:hypothetical protein KKH65_01060 [bacterium]|nr:hypothetical protein [bacterium]